MSDWDYQIVWAPSLTVKVPIVHDTAHRERQRKRGETTEVVSRCGTQVIERIINSEYYEYGAFLYAEHARTLGCIWCKRCYPSAVSP